MIFVNKEFALQKVPFKQSNTITIPKFKKLRKFNVTPFSAAVNQRRAYIKASKHFHWLHCITISNISPPY